MIDLEADSVLNIARRDMGAVGQVIDVEVGQVCKYKDIHCGIISWPHQHIHVMVIVHEYLACHGPGSPSATARSRRNM